MLNLSWPVAVSQTSTDSHVCIELLWETQQGSGGLVARETQWTVRKWPTELSSLQTGSLQTFCLCHRTLYAFFEHCPFALVCTLREKGCPHMNLAEHCRLFKSTWLFVLQYNNHFLNKFCICFFTLWLFSFFYTFTQPHSRPKYTTNTLLAIICNILCLMKSTAIFIILYLNQFRFV